MNKYLYIPICIYIYMYLYIYMFTCEIVKAVTLPLITAQSESTTILICNFTHTYMNKYLYIHIDKDIYIHEWVLYMHIEKYIYIYIYMFTCTIPHSQGGDFTPDHRSVGVHHDTYMYTLLTHTWTHVCIHHSHIFSHTPQSKLWLCLWPPLSWSPPRYLYVYITHTYMNKYLYIHT
jgi:hypothetical protein